MEVVLSPPDWGCTANVYYNDILVKSFTAHTCAIARAMACDYIEEQGGICPPLAPVTDIN